MGARVDYGEIRRLREAGLRNDDIAKQLGCCESTVVHVVKKLGMPPRPAGPRKPIDVPLLYRLWNSDASSGEIANQLGISSSTLALVRKRHGLPVRQQRRRESVDTDPTPAEIEERARELRERHYAQRRAEREDAVRSLVWHRRQREMKA